MSPEKIVFRVFLFAILVIIFCLGWFFIGYYYGDKNANKIKTKNAYTIDNHIDSDTVILILNKRKNEQ